MIRNSYSLDYFFIEMFGHFLDKKFSLLFFGNHAKSYLDNSKIWRNDGKTICFTS